MTLADYRVRHAQYKLDPALQATHAAFPFIATVDPGEKSAVTLSVSSTSPNCASRSRAEGDPPCRRAYHLVQKLNYLAGARDAKFSA